ncbi:ABC transporter permease [Paludibaculum fermentans]|uniref:ABC transporter permease n=1 Tax=Paludibaculum fermentans TaxID=1473598 RepID=UPI003EC141CB
MLDHCVHNLRQAIRSLRSAPAITCMAILSLALGIGANTAIFSLINALMLRTLPVSHPEELRQVTMASPQFFSNPLWEQIRDHQQVFSTLFAYGRWRFNLASGGEARYANGVFASGQYFDTLGVRPALGRVLAPVDDWRGCPGVAVLSHGFWQKEYGGRPGILGQTISLDGHPLPIAGVTGPGFTGVDVGSTFDVMVPLCAEKVLHGETSNLDINAAPGNYNTLYAWLRIVGRPKPGISASMATAQMKALAPAIFQATLPAHWRLPEQQQYLQRTLITNPFATGLSYLREQYHDALMVLMGIVAVVLLIACANVANLLFARCVARRREFAIRMALGAGRGRLVRQLLTESLLLAGLGGLLGIIFARWATAGLLAILDVPLDAAPDWRVLAFTASVALLTCVLFGLAPAWRGTRVSPYAAMKSNSRDVIQGTRFGTARALVALQLALSLPLVVGAGLMLTTLWKLMSRESGFAKDQVLIANIDLRNGRYDPALRRQAYLRMLAKLRAIPAVRSAAVSNLTPICGCAATRELALEQSPGRTAPVIAVDTNFVGDGFFDALGTALVAGRDFDEHDTPEAPAVAIVNQAMAKLYFGSTSPLGSRFRVRQGNRMSDPVEIIGVAGDVRYGSMRDSIQPIVYLAWNQDPTPYPMTNFELRSAGAAPGSLTSAVQSAIAEVNPSVSIEFTTLAGRIEESLSKERLMAILSGCFGALALTLAAIGLYGVVSYAVARRTGEIGIRMALGAQQERILRMVLREVFITACVGLCAGIAVTMGLTKFIAGLVYGLAPNDPVTFGIAAGILMLIAILAGYWPARRAARIHPLSALHEE